MARITVEDCLLHVENHFELVLLAAKRSRQLIFGGEESLVPWGEDKATVVALREIAAGHIDSKALLAAQEPAKPVTPKFRGEPMLSDDDILAG